MITRHSVDVAVRWSESDPAGIAFYPKFFEWFDIACASLFDDIGLSWPALFPARGIVGVPIVECGARFLSPVRWGDTIRVTATIAWVKEKMFRVEYAVAVGDRACATGFEVRAWVGRPAAPGDPLRALPIPADVVARLTSQPQDDARIKKEGDVMKPEVVFTSAAPKTGFSEGTESPIAQGVKCGDFVFVSGQGPLDPVTKKIVSDDIAEQTRVTLDNVRIVLEAAGSGVEHMVKVGVFLRDMKDFAVFNRVFKEYMKGVQPARTTVEAAPPRAGVNVEIDAIAWIPTR